MSPTVMHSFLPTINTTFSLISAADGRGWQAIRQWAETVGAFSSSNAPIDTHDIQGRLASLLENHPPGRLFAHHLRIAKPNEILPLTREMDGTPLAAWFDQHLTGDIRNHMQLQRISLRLLQKDPSLATQRQPATFLDLGIKAFLEGEAEAPLTLPQEPSRDLLNVQETIRDAFNRGVRLQKAGRTVEARDAYREVFARDPEATVIKIHVLACLNMGKTYLVEGDFEHAAYVLEHALELDPRQMEPRNNYAVSLLALGKVEAAIEQWATILERLEAKEDNHERVTFIKNATKHALHGILIKSVRQHDYRSAFITLEVLLQYDPTSSELQELQGNLKVEHRMMSRLSKTLALALRHRPSLFELEIDEEGWVPVDQLLSALQQKKNWADLNRAVLEKTVQTVSEGRYEIKDDKIRALYGHSVKGKLKKEPGNPPDILYHGTDETFLDSILKHGLKPKKRQYVHLSTSYKQALKVGQRKGDNTVVLIIKTKSLIEQGFQFYIGNSKVWLSDALPPEAIEIHR